MTRTSSRGIVRRPHTWHWARIACLAAALGAATLQATTPPSAESLVDRVVEALGGRESWDAVESMEIVGTFSTFSSTAPFVILHHRPNLYRFEHQEAGIDVTVGFDGHSAWWTNGWIPWAEVDWPTAPPTVYARGFEADAEFVWPFLDAAERGHRLELRGLTAFEGQPSWELAIELANGTHEVWHFDAESYLPIVRTARAGFLGSEWENRSFFSDFRTVGSLKMPFRIDNELGNRVGEMIVEEIRLDPELDPTAFQLPLAPLMQRLASLAGRWNVDISSRQLPSLPWITDTTTSEIVRRFDGRVLEELLSFSFAGRPRTIRRSYAYDRFRDRFTIVQIDSLTAHPILLTGDPAAEPLVASSLGTETGWAVGERSILDRYVLREIATDRFVLELERSFDGGQGWLSFARFEYNREAEP